MGPVLSGLARPARAAAVGLGRLFVELVYPPSCIACGSATGAPHTLCGGCWAQIRFIERPYCERLGTPFAVDLGMPLVSPAAIANPPVFARARAVARYDDTARRLVHKLKYSDRMEVARALGALMARAGSELAAECDMIVPVPLHPVRLWTRRFNQAMELARAMGRLHGKPVEPGLLSRVKRTRPQIGLSRSQRAENLQGAFRVDPAARARLKGRRVLLDDDVMTTGATANAASRALLRGGADAVDVVTFARVVAES